MSNIDRLEGVSDGLGQKAPVACATTGPIVLNGLQTIDTVVQGEGTRTLVKDQADQTLNGVWNASSGPWTRALDFDGARDVISGTQVGVAGGTQAGIVFLTSIAPPFIIGAGAITFRPSTAIASNAPWTVWMPSVRSDAGVLSQYFSEGRYQIAGKRLHATYTLTIPSGGSGTGGGALIFTLPPGATFAGPAVGVGRDVSPSGGKMLQAAGITDGNEFGLVTYDNNSAIRDGAIICISITAEIK